MLKFHHKKLAFLIFFLIVLIGVIGIAQSGKIFLLGPKKIQDFVSGYGIFAPIAFLIINFLQILFPIIPGQIVHIAAGYLFGALGILYCYIANFLASLFVFYLSRKFGRSFIKKFIYEKDLRHLDYFIKKKGLSALIIARSVPFFPSDAVNFVSGASKLTYKQFIIGTLIGLAPSIIIFNLFGSKLALGTFDLKLIILTIIASLFPTFYLFRHKMKIFFIKEIRLIENKIKNK